MTTRLKYCPWAPLRAGVTVLEASAGTGKTHQITNVVLRLVTELGIPIDQILVMTFTKAATAELCDRIRSRLHQARQVLEDPQHTPDEAFFQEFQRRTVSLGKIEEFSTRLRDAIANFDQAFITTIHAFCQRMLQVHTFDTGLSPGVELIEDATLTQLREQLVNDAMTRRLYTVTRDEYIELTEEGSYKPKNLDDIAQKSMNQFNLEVLPRPSDTSDPPSTERADFANHIRTGMTDVLRARNAVTYQDLLRLLEGPLCNDNDPDTQARLRTSIGGMFKAVLLDEFQDTDPLQWNIFKSVFAHGDHYLTLIGDPKQAIYGFRGANIYVYLEAVSLASEADALLWMDRNYRTDQSLLIGLQKLLEHPTLFGHPSIQFSPVGHHYEDRLLASSQAPDAATPIEIRYLDGGSKIGADAPFKQMSKTDAEALLPSRVASDIVQHLSDGLQIRGEEEECARDINPGDIAVLVRKGDHARAIQTALSARGVPAVLSGADNVFGCDEAAEILRWLKAVNNPRQIGEASSAAATKMFGWTAQQIDMAQHTMRHNGAHAGSAQVSNDWGEWMRSLHDTSQSFAKTGFFISFNQALRRFESYSRLLSSGNGERRVTNLRHLCELIHQAEKEGSLGLNGLINWLSQKIANADSKSEEYELRLESDARCVKILTMHKSKGLQFPIVYAPYLWTGPSSRWEDKVAAVVANPDHPTIRMLDLRNYKNNPEKIEWLSQAEQEGMNEAVRLFYVACTRAEHQLVLYCADAKNNLENSPLGAALFKDQKSELSCREDAKTTILGLEENDRFEHISKTIGQWNQGWSKPLFALSRCLPTTSDRYQEAQMTHPVLSAKIFSRGTLDTLWSRNSYSSIKRRMESLSTYHQVEEAPTAADYDAEVVDGPDIIQDHSNVLPFAEFPAGPEAGTFLHALFEHIDFTQDATHIEEVAARLAPEHGYSATEWAKKLSGWMLPVLQTSLGAPVGGVGLNQISTTDRLDELEFDFSIGSQQGDHFISGAALVDALKNGEDEESPPASYLRQLSSKRLPALAGFITGSIDLVFHANGKWFLADYKSNRIGPTSGDSIKKSDFEQHHLNQQMEHHHYYLQSAIYALALHRYLRTRVKGYQYNQHFGGVYYLFFRGMVGDPDLGVHYRRPSQDLIEAMDSLFGDRT